MADFKTAYKRLKLLRAAIVSTPMTLAAKLIKEYLVKLTLIGTVGFLLMLLRKLILLLLRVFLKRLPNLKRKFKTFIKTSIGIVLSSMMFQVNLLLNKCLIPLLIKVRLLLLDLLNVCLTLEKLVNGRLTF